MEEIHLRWLNKDFIERALHAAGDSSVEVDSYDVTKATDLGDYNISDTYRVTASVTRGFGPELTSFFVKCSRESKDVIEVRDHYNERN
jgi:hypothetical protein